MQDTDNQFSRILSYILHPLMIPLFATSAIMLRPDIYTIVLPAYLKIWFISVIVVFTIIIPVAGVLILKKLKAITSIEMNKRGERTIPLLIASSSFMALLFSLRSTNMPPIFLYLLYSATFALLAGLLINMVYKISLHTLGWSALAATLTAVSIRIGISLLLYILIAWLLAGVAGYARLKQNAHNQTQVYLGYVAGVLIIILISCFS